MQEWLAAFYAYRAAQARMATAAAYLSLLQWERGVSTLAPSPGVTQWAEYSVRVIRSFRRRQRLLAQSYLQYVRALEIQEPLGDPIMGGGESLEDYRRSFLEGLQDAALLGGDADTSWPADPDWDFVTSELRQFDPEGASRNARGANFTDVDLDRHIQEFLDSVEGDHPVSRVEFNWPEDEGESNDRAHLEYLLRRLKELRKEVADRDRRRDNLRDEPADRETVKREYEESVRGAGNVVAGEVMSATSHAADQVTDRALRSDRKIRAVARGTAANPCAFCAMLASRGFVYSGDSFGSGDMTTAFRRVHKNCQCYPIIRYVDADELPELNRKFRQMWDNAQGTGKDRLNSFRRALYAENRDAINTKRRQRYWDKKSQREWEAAG